MTGKIYKKLRPIKLALLVKPNKRSSLVKAVELASAIWGGMYCPIIPVYKRFPVSFRRSYRLIQKPLKFYKGLLANFEPDYLVSIDNFSEDYLKEISPDREVISYSSIIENLENRDTSNAIGIHEILNYLAKQEFKYQRIDGARIYLPKISDPFVKMVLGYPGNSIHEKISNRENDDLPVIEGEASLENHYEFLNGSIWTYNRISNYGLGTFGNSFWGEKDAIFLLDSNNVDDLIKFWNLRAVGWNVFPAPLANIELPEFESHLQGFVIKSKQNASILGGISILFGSNISEDQANQFYARVKGMTEDDDQFRISFHGWYPRIWSDYALRYDHCLCPPLIYKNEETPLNITSQFFSEKLIIPPFVQYSRNGKPKFVNELEISFDYMQHSYAEVLPELPAAEVKWLYQNFEQYYSSLARMDWRISKGNLVLLCNSGSDWFRYSLPNAEKVFEIWFKAKKYDIRISQAGKLAKEVLFHLGGFPGTNFLCNERIIELMQNFKNGKVVIQKTLFDSLSRLINKYPDSFRVKEKSYYVQLLLEKKMLQFGNQVKCTICGRKNFYPTIELKNVVSCHYCLNKFKIPSHSPDEIKWAYKARGAFSQNNQAEGIYCTFLTMRFFKISLHSVLTSMLSFELKKETDRDFDSEIDLAFFFKNFQNSIDKPDLFFCECKVFIEFSQGDMDKMKLLGERFPGVFLVFATLNKTLSDNEIQILTKLCNQFRKGISARPVNPILILTGNELLKKMDALRELKPMIIPHREGEDKLFHLSDITVQKYLGLESWDTLIQKRIDAKRAKARS